MILEKWYLNTPRLWGKIGSTLAYTLLHSQYLNNYYFLKRRLSILWMNCMQRHLKWRRLGKTGTHRLYLFIYAKDHCTILSGKLELLPDRLAYVAKPLFFFSYFYRNVQEKFKKRRKSWSTWLSRMFCFVPNSTGLSHCINNQCSSKCSRALIWSIGSGMFGKYHENTGRHIETNRTFLSFWSHQTPRCP